MLDSLTGTISFQALQQIKVVDDILLSVNTIKHFLGKIAERCTLQKKSNSPSNAPMSQDIAIKKVMEPLFQKNENYTDRTEPVHKAADEEDLPSLFDQ